jgi:hypothetical protein
MDALFHLPISPRFLAVVASPFYNHYYGLTRVKKSRALPMHILYCQSCPVLRSARRRGQYYASDISI